MITGTARADASRDCRIGVAFTPDPQTGDHYWYRANVAAAREFSALLRDHGGKLVVIDDRPSADLKRLPCEQYFMPPWPWR